jgi:MFS family permease
MQNWPRWKKELNLGALLVTVALVGVMKTAFISVNSSLAMGYDVSFTAATALTGVPLILSAFTGLASLVAARIWGKRPVYLASAMFIFIGAMWNMRVPSFAQCMAARVFQGLGWGAFDTLVLGSIHDTYFVSFPTRLGLSHSNHR